RHSTGAGSRGASAAAGAAGRRGSVTREPSWRPWPAPARPLAMPRSFLAALRGSDGRSLARALAILVFVNALLAGLHGGMMAEAATGRTLITCSFAGGGHLPVGPVRDGERACCVLGCAT